jgi:AcrR family transcriptional regulator
VSIGTLYQYFPNRQSLIRAVLERYLAEMSASIEADCRSLAGRSLDEIAAGLIDAFIAAKWRRLEGDASIISDIRYCYDVAGVRNCAPHRVLGQFTRKLWCDLRRNRQNFFAGSDQKLNFILIVDHLGLLQWVNLNREAGQIATRSTSSRLISSRRRS